MSCLKGPSFPWVVVHGFPERLSLLGLWPSLAGFQGTRPLRTSLWAVLPTMTTLAPKARECPSVPDMAALVGHRVLLLGLTVRSVVVLVPELGVPWKRSADGVFLGRSSWGGTVFWEVCPGPSQGLPRCRS